MISYFRRHRRRVVITLTFAFWPQSFPLSRCSPSTSLFYLSHLVPTSSSFPSQPSSLNLFFPYSLNQEKLDEKSDEACTLTHISFKVSRNEVGGILLKNINFIWYPPPSALTFSPRRYFAFSTIEALLEFAGLPGLITRRKQWRH